MQLCRFQLLESPGVARSGIFFEDRLYETDGERALGVHGLDKVQLLAPLLVPASVRAFHADGTFAYWNGAGLLGPLGELELGEGGLSGWAVGLAAVLRDGGKQFEPEEADGAILGYMLVIALKDSVGGYDMPLAVGPFVTTPEALEDELTKTLSFQLKLKKNGSESDIIDYPAPDFRKFISLASARRAMFPGELMIGPLHEVSDPLLPGDVVEVFHAKMGPLTLRMV